MDPYRHSERSAGSQRASRLSREKVLGDISCREVAETARDVLIVQVLDYLVGTRPLLGRDDEIDVATTEAI